MSTADAERPDDEPGDTGDVLRALRRAARSVNPHGDPVVGVPLSVVRAAAREIGRTAPPSPDPTSDRLVAAVAERARRLLDTCPACAERDAARASAPKLSPRRREMLTLASQGLTVEQIARRCFVAPPTVATTLRFAREALGANDTTHAVAIAVRLGVIE